MRSDIHIEPESDEEIEFIDQLSQARTYAVEETDMNPEDVAVIFSAFATGMFSESGRDVRPPKTHECPQCGQELKDVETPGLGMDPRAVPCGCSVQYDDLPQELFLDQ